ncbi:hypothetical protein [Bacillus thuringiensis]|uniref:hypothetical protein n=1 Tax=Bacillus thuringiensis TaxID=1428 RepID=UPI002100EC9A|nr:hypothetical protein [Bacillus thuringiensis]
MDWLIPLVGSLYLGMKALQIVQSVAKGFGLLYDAAGLVMRGLGLLIPVTAGQTAGQTALNVATWLFPGVWITAAIMGVVAAGVLMWKNWDEIAAWGKWLWGEIKKVWSGIKKDVVEAYDKMVSKAKEWWGDTKRKWDDTVSAAKSKASEMYTEVVNKYESMKTDATNKLAEMTSKASQKWNEAYNSATSWASNMWDAGVANAKAMSQGFKNNVDDLGDAVWNGMKSAWNSIKSWGNTFYNSGAALLGEFADGVWKGVTMAYDNVWEGMKYIRNLLPFSPAKEGPLSDLDKSGEAFFPTWYEAAMTKTGAMQKAVSGAFGGVADAANVALAGSGLAAFTGGNTSVTVNHVVTVEGDVSLDSRGLEDLQSTIQQQVVGSTGVTGFVFDKQVIRRN